jgi:hypothetical protein
MDKETQGFSVDAKSNIRLAKKARLPPGGGIVFIEAEFSPNHTEETYIVGRLFVINPVS